MCCLVYLPLSTLFQSWKLFWSFLVNWSTQLTIFLSITSSELKYLTIPKHKKEEIVLYAGLARSLKLKFDGVSHLIPQMNSHFICHLTEEEKTPNTPMHMLQINRMAKKLMEFNPHISKAPRCQQNSCWRWPIYNPIALSFDISLGVSNQFGNQDTSQDLIKKEMKVSTWIFKKNCILLRVDKF